jgi:hypothetical protein
MDVSDSAATSSTRATPRAHLLVVCCASGDGTLLEPAFDLLRARGFDIAVLEGAQVRAPATIKRVRRHGARAIFVLVKSAQLDKGSSARLAQVLQSTRVLPKHIVEVVFDWRDPLALVQQLQALEPDRPPIVDRTPTSPRPVVRTRSQSRVAGSREPTGPRRTVTELPSRREKARSSRPATKVARAKMVRKAEPRPPSNEPALEATTAHVTPAQVLAHVDPADVDPNHVSSDDAPTASYAPVSAALPGSIGATPNDVLIDAPRGSSDLDDRPAPRSPSATGGIGKLMTGSFAATTRRGLRLAARSIAGPRARMLAFASGGIGALVLAGVLLATSGNDDDVLVTQSPTNVAKVSVPRAEPEELEEEPSQAGPTRQDAIAQARVQGELGIHEGIVYAPLDSPKQDFEGAAAMCDEMNRGAIGGWRMPKLGELHTLAAAHVVERGVYWSGTEADGFPGSALLWSEKNTRAAPIGKRWKGARSLCVLDDPETN